RRPVATTGRDGTHAHTPIAVHFHAPAGIGRDLPLGRCAGTGAFWRTTGAGSRTGRGSAAGHRARRSHASTRGTHRTLFRSAAPRATSGRSIGQRRTCQARAGVSAVAQRAVEAGTRGTLLSHRCKG